ncbi:Vesicle-associated membrane protein 713 [Frankliniella fusca]|uniref:Vesicle-associated membrane protein 7 n=1 Tax=Frankliniella fusca TaxID=407009 RepID=A0AAE1LIH9_9NEOP|nr:Vesicle-associated membrane protein 713 [Frankliniella fusca]
MARRPRLQITFSAIMNRGVILVSHQEEDNENLSENLQEIKEKLKNVEETSYEQMHTYNIPSCCPIHILLDKGIVFLCITKHSESEYLPFAFLRHVRDKFSEQPSLISRSYRAGEDEFDRDFRPVLVQILDDFNSGRADKLSQVEEQVEDVKQIMRDNVERIIDRGERLDDLLSKALGLESQGQEFRQQTHAVFVQARCRNLKMWLVIGVLFLIFLTVVVLFATGVIKS